MGAQGQQSQNADNSLDLLWIMVLIVVAAGLIWWFGKSYITAFIFWLRYYEIVAIKAVLDLWNGFAAALHLPVASLAGLTEWQAYIDNNAGPADFATLAQVSRYVGGYTRWPYAIILSALGVWLYFAHLSLRFKNVYSMDSLRRIERDNWPMFTPIMKENLVAKPLDEGPWALAQTPLQFVKAHDLMVLEDNPEGGPPIVNVNEGAAHSVFSLQLGRRWNGVERLPMPAKAVFAVFAARANRDRAAASKLVRQFSETSGSGKPDFAGVEDLLNKYKDSKLVKLAISRHSYVLTVMASMVELARSDGVIATADFLWLKPIDRPLWYMLNSTGRQTPVCEAAGPFAHWLAEVTLSRSIGSPMVDQAVNGLKLAMDDLIYEPDEEE